MYSPNITLNFPQHFLIFQPDNTLYLLPWPEPTTLSRLFITQCIRHNRIFMAIIPIITYCIFTHIWRIGISLLLIINNPNIYWAVVTAGLGYHLQRKTILLLIYIYRPVYYKLTLSVKLCTSDEILMDCEVCTWWICQTMK